MPRSSSSVRGRRLDFVEKNLQRRVWRDHVETERRFAHFTDALPQGCGVLGAVMGVERERHFQLVDRLGGQAGKEDFVEPLEGVVKALEAPYAFFDGEAGPLRFFESGQARERGQAVEWLIGAHETKRGQ